MSQASQLYRFQQIEIRGSQIVERKAEIARVLADAAPVRTAQAATQAAQDRLVQARSENGASEQAVQSQQDKIARTEQALYGGSVQNPKELQDLQQEAISLKKHLKTLEDRLLETMLELDEAETGFESAGAALELAEADAAAQHQGLQVELKDLEAEDDRLQAEREACLASIGGEELALYEKIKQNLGPIVLALVEDDACSACGVVLPASQRPLVRGGTELVRCSQCGRILYSG